MGVHGLLLRPFTIMHKMPIPITSRRFEENSDADHVRRAASHVPGMTAWAEAAPVEQKDRVYGAFDKLRQELDASGTDTLIVLTSEHWANFFLDHIGAFCIGRPRATAGRSSPGSRSRGSRSRAIRSSPPN